MGVRESDGRDAGIKMTVGDNEDILFYKKELEESRERIKNMEEVIMRVVEQLLRAETGNKLVIFGMNELLGLLPKDKQEEEMKKLGGVILF